MPDSARGYLLSPLAENDLEDIWLYTYQAWSRDQADRYHASIISAIEGLASGDRKSRDASDIRESYRRYSAGRHVIFFRDDDDAIIVVRILHQSMDLPAQLGGSDN